MRHVVPSFILLGLVAAAYMVGALVAEEPDHARNTRPRGAGDQDLLQAAAPDDITEVRHFVGLQSCASTACHGSVRPDLREFVKSDDPCTADHRILRNEFFFWRENDPHADAGTDLYNQRSVRILENLGALDRQDGISRTTAKYANILGSCAECHSPAAATLIDAANLSTGSPHNLDAVAGMANGVACQSCHGAASDWLSPHYDDDWQCHSVEEKEAKFGLHNTKSLLSRARKCATCHVGKAGMDVNHDLIAAGHPPLKFEFSAYMDAMPKHWDQEREQADTPDYEVQAWTAGQIATAEASLNLLAARADAKDPAWKQTQPVYPEFAEYDCFACHHDLQSSSWRQDPSPDQRPGALRWGSWYHTLTADFVKTSSTPEAAHYVRELNKLRALMTKGLASAPASDVNSQALLAKQALLAWAESADLPTRLSADSETASFADIQAQVVALTEEYLAEDRRAVENWDVAMQVYFLLAMRHAASLDKTRSNETPGTFPKSERLKAIHSLRSALAFPKSYDSPKSFGDAGESDSQTNSSLRERIETQIKSLHDKLGQ